MWPWRKKVVKKPFTDEIAQRVAEHARRQVAAGFESEREIVDGICDWLVGAYEGEESTLRAAAAGAVASAVRAQLAAQERWPPVTDFDRLAAAFGTLEAAGIVARHNWTCCMNCGNAEIGGEFKKLKKAGVKVRGYTFYHMQDTECAVDGGGLYLVYSSTGSDEESVRVGHEIVEHLSRQGLATDWSGELSARIVVKLDWKRRWGSTD